MSHREWDSQEIRIPILQRETLKHSKVRPLLRGWDWAWLQSLCPSPRPNCFPKTGSSELCAHITSGPWPEGRLPRGSSAGISLTSTPQAAGFVHITLFSKDSTSTYSVPGLCWVTGMNRRPQTGGRWTDRQTFRGSIVLTRPWDTCFSPVSIHLDIHSICIYGALTVYQPLKETQTQTGTNSSPSSLRGP